MEVKVAPKRMLGVHLPSPTEMVCSILGSTFIKYKLPSIPRDSIYYGFYHLAKKYPQYFGEFFFVMRGGVPHSKDLEDILFRLGGVMSVTNPDYQNMMFHQEALEAINKMISKWQPIVKNQIDTMAEKFYEAYMMQNSSTSK